MREPCTGLDATARAELLHRADLLQVAATEVIADLDLPALLGQLGYVEHLGSSVSGLMVWRDIDFAVRCRDLTPGRAWDALRPLLAQPRLMRLNYWNEAGERSPTGRADDQRDYFVVYVASAAGDEWKIDLSLWLSDAPRPHLAQLDDLRRGSPSSGSRTSGTACRATRRRSAASTSTTRCSSMGCVPRTSSRSICASGAGPRANGGGITYHRLALLISTATYRRAVASDPPWIRSARDLHPSLGTRPATTATDCLVP
jgi:hypothetical protein